MDRRPGRPTLSEAEKARRAAQRAQSLAAVGRLWYARAETAAILGLSVATIIRLENRKILEKHRPAGTPNGRVYHNTAQVHDLAESGLLAEGRVETALTNGGPPQQPIEAAPIPSPPPQEQPPNQAKTAEEKVLEPEKRREQRRSTDDAVLGGVLRALDALRAENERLRAELENARAAGDAPKEKAPAGSEVWQAAHKASLTSGGGRDEKTLPARTT